jgi:hypothetical protein
MLVIFFSEQMTKTPTNFLQVRNGAFKAHFVTRSGFGFEPPEYVSRGIYYIMWLSVLSAQSAFIVQCKPRPIRKDSIGYLTALL